MKCRLKDECIRDKKEYCYKCIHNIEITIPKNYFKQYEPVCPVGYTDCVIDPAYIACHYPDWYKDLYGDLTPIQASAKSCHPSSDMFCEDYDDEDK